MGVAPQRSVLASAALACAALIASATAYAQESADGLIDRGVTLREQGHDAEALALFQRAHALSPSGRALAQIAMAEQALALWEPAEAHLVEALGRGDAWVEERRSLFEGALAVIREHLGSLEIEGGVEGAEVVVGGETRGRLPLEGALRVPTGSVQLEVRAPGHAPYRDTLTVRPGQVTTARVAMAPLAPEAETTTPHPESATPEAEATPTSGGGPDLTAPLVILASGGAVAAVGAVLLGLAFGDKAYVEDPPDGTTWSEDREAARDRVPTFAAAGEILLGVGAAALAAGLVFLIVQLSGDDEPPVRASADGRFVISL